MAGVANPETGWGRRDESWTVMEALGAVGGETWFRLGDKDLATHIERTRRLRAGESLSSVTRDLAARLGVKPAMVPMSDDPVRTMVATDRGRARLPGLVRAPAVRAGRALRPLRRRRAWRGRILPCSISTACAASSSARPTLSSAWRRSWPLPGVRAALEQAKVPRVAVTPIVGGQAIKGPAAKMLAELGHDVSALGVARYYKDWVDGFVLDAQDAALARRHRAHWA